MDSVVAIAQLKGLVFYFQKYRESCFKKAKLEAKVIEESMEIEVVFPKKSKQIIKMIVWSRSRESKGKCSIHIVS